MATHCGWVLPAHCACRLPHLPTERGSFSVGHFSDWILILAGSSLPREDGESFLGQATCWSGILLYVSHSFPSVSGTGMGISDTQGQREFLSWATCFYRVSLSSASSVSLSGREEFQALEERRALPWLLIVERSPSPSALLVVPGSPYLVLLDGGKSLLGLPSITRSGV